MWITLGYSLQVEPVPLRLDWVGRKGRRIMDDTWVFSLITGWMVMPFTGPEKTGKGIGFEGKIINFVLNIKFERPRRTVKKVLLIIDMCHELRVEFSAINFNVISK